MPDRNADLHGNVPDTAPVALLLIDVINDLEFEGGDRLLEHALPMAERLATLKARAKGLGIPAVYVNDNFGKWQSNLATLLNHCLQADVRGRPVVERLAPAPDDYFVLKPKHSGFFSTTLDLLLAYLKARTLVITGLTGNVCVLFTAADAYMRDLGLVVPADCVASIDGGDNARALEQMRTVLGALVAPSAALDLEALVDGEPAEVPGSVLAEARDAGGDRMNATVLLKQQHKQVKDLFKKVEQTEDARERRSLMDQIKQALEAHTKIEEELFYPAVRETGDKGEEMVAEALEEHHVVDLVLAELPRVDPEDERFEAKMTVLSELVEHHVKEEEGEMFKIAQKLGRSELSDLGERMEARFEELIGGRRRAA